MLLSDPDQNTIASKITNQSLDKSVEKLYFVSDRSAEGVKKTTAKLPLHQTSVSVSRCAIVSCTTHGVGSTRGIEVHSILTISGSCLHRAAVPSAWRCTPCPIRPRFPVLTRILPILNLHMVRLMVLVALVVPMVTSATPAHADDKTVGIGLEFGQGPGLSLKVTT
jgi:hypothetical protein